MCMYAVRGNAREMKKSNHHVHEEVPEALNTHTAGFAVTR
jgi:hypothetical protein